MSWGTSSDSDDHGDGADGSNTATAGGGGRGDGSFATVSELADTVSEAVENASSKRSLVRMKGLKSLVRVIQSSPYGT